MAKYSRALDLVTSSLRLAQKGQMEKAAKLFEAALKSKDLASTLDSIEKQQVAAFAEAQKANPTLASLFTEIAKGKTKKKAKAGKGKPFGGKQAPPFKKKSKAKASEGEDGDDDETESGLDDDLAPVLDEMTADDFGDEGLDAVDGDDLSLEDLDEVLDDGDGVAEMPEATAAEGDDDEGEEESSDDEGKDDEEESSDESEEESSDDSDDKEGEEESAPAQTAKVKVVASNIAALDRLRKSKTQAGAKKPAK